MIGAHQFMGAEILSYFKVQSKGVKQAHQSGSVSPTGLRGETSSELSDSSAL
jgi:hypothetical protein